MCIAIASSLGMLLVPSVAEEFEIPISTAQWMLTINLLAGAVATPVLGRLADGRYKRGLLIIVLLIVMVGSVIAATATEFWVFLIGRILQGLTFGIGPVTLAIARAILPAEIVGKTVAALAITAATGMGLGYPLTGVLAGLFGFRSAFFFAIAFVLIVLALIVAAIPGGADPSVVRRPFDLAGAIVFGAALAATLLVVSEGPVWGWTSTPTLVLAAIAVGLLVIWAVIELRSAHPLIDLRALRVPDVFLANASGFFFSIMMFICLSVASLVAQMPTSTGYGVGIPVLWAGFVMLPFSIGTFVASRTFGLLRRHIDTTMLLPLGGVFFTVALLLLTFAHDRLWELVLGLLLCGFGTGLTFGAMPLLISRRVQASRVGSALGFNQVLRTTGNSIGSAIPAAVLAATATTLGTPSGAGISLVFAIGAGIGIVVTILIGGYLLFGFRGDVRIA